jgi:hypothetical protein
MAQDKCKYQKQHQINLPPTHQLYNKINRRTQRKTIHPTLT